MRIQIHNTAIMIFLIGSTSVRNVSAASDSLFNNCVDRQAGPRSWSPACTSIYTSTSMRKSSLVLFKQIHTHDLRLVPNSDILNFCLFIHNCEIHTIDESFGNYNCNQIILTRVETKMLFYIFSKIRNFLYVDEILQNLVFGQIVQIYRYPFSRKSPNSFFCRENVSKNNENVLQQLLIVQAATCICFFTYFYKSFRESKVFSQKSYINFCWAKMHIYEVQVLIPTNMPIKIIFFKW